MKIDQQRRAIISTAKQLAVIACAGSGKTSTLIKRVAHKLQNGEASPTSVTIITFTVKAAEEIRLRLGDAISNKQAMSEIYVGTIHGFCRHALTTFMPREYESLDVISEIQQLAILSVHRKDWTLSEINPIQFQNAKGVFFQSLVTAFNIIKQEQIPFDRLNALHPPIAKAFAKYSEYLNENNLADFTDLVLLTKRHLDSSEEFRDRIRARAHWLFVDEYQDVDPLQHALILKLSEQGYLCAIGDDDQAIYQFRGTDFRHFISLTQPASGRDVIPLSTNYRCRDNILQNGKRVIERVSERIKKPMDAYKSGGEVISHLFDHVNDEAQFIASEIKQLIESGAVGHYNEIAILLRSVSSNAQHYIRALQEHGIPFRTRGDGSLFEEPTVAIVCRVLEFIAQENTDVAHMQILGAPYDKFTAPGDWTDFNDNDFINGGLTTHQVLLFRQWEGIRGRYIGRKFTSLLELVLDVIGSLEVLGSEREPIVGPNVGVLTQLVQEFDQVAQTKNLFFLCGFLAMHSDKIADQVFSAALDDAVNILTVHQSKGLQFSIVFVPMLCKGRFPSEKNDSNSIIDSSLYNYSRYHTGIEEELRLFYVAITRASDRLYVSCSANVGLVKPRLPSDFFNAVKPMASKDTLQSITSTDRQDLPLNTSYSSLELYLSCPYRYRLAKTYGLTTPPNPFYEFGRVLHQVLRQVHELYIAGVTASDADVERMYAESFKLRLYVPKVTIDVRRAAGLRAIKAYVKNRTDWLANTYAVEKDFNFVLNNSILSGRYDLIIKNDGYVIVDFKTGRPHDYINTEFQLGLYSMVAAEYLGLPVQRAITFYVEHDVETEYRLNPDSHRLVKLKYESTVKAIRAQEFSATPGPVCVRCEYRNICPSKE